MAQLLGASEEQPAALVVDNPKVGVSEGSAGAPPQGSDAVWSLDGAIPPGRTAAVALIEHLWAEPLREAIRTAGGSPLGETWLAPDDLERLEKLTVDE